mmetsp:Transcript_22631/g.68372  ORF Transcript_22631/g.68372 Transcript_22631/m.68372 type:complete len:284 (-) Transcript_22631:785-1636(-)
MSFCGLLLQRLWPMEPAGQAITAPNSAAAREPGTHAGAQSGWAPAAGARACRHAAAHLHGRGTAPGWPQGSEQERQGPGQLAAGRPQPARVGHVAAAVEALALLPDPVARVGRVEPLPQRLREARPVRHGGPEGGLGDDAVVVAGRRVHDNARAVRWGRQVPDDELAVALRPGHVGRAQRGVAPVALDVHGKGELVVLRVHEEVGRADKGQAIGCHEALPALLARVLLLARVVEEGRGVGELEGRPHLVAEGVPVHAVGLGRDRHPEPRVQEAHDAGLAHDGL